MKAIIQNIVDKLEKLVKNYKDLQGENSKLQKGNDELATEHRGEPEDDKDNPFDKKKGGIKKCLPKIYLYFYSPL